jgi:hypothetical protein
MNAIIRPYQVRDPMQRIHLLIRRARSGIPTLSSGVWMRMELSNDHSTGHQRWIAQVNDRASSPLCPPGDELSRGNIHVDPATFFMPARGIRRF